MDRRWVRALFYYFIAAMFVPFPIIMLPVVKQTALLGIDNEAGLILLYVVYGLAFNLLLYTSYIRSVPHEIEESAAVDGASRWAIFSCCLATAACCSSNCSARMSSNLL